jgi:hypothetical protein
MRAFYRSRPGRKPRGPVAVYEQIGVPEFCCGSIQRAWGSVICFGINGHATTSHEVNIFTLRPQDTGLVAGGDGNPVLSVV